MSQSPPKPDPTGPAKEPEAAATAKSAVTTPAPSAKSTATPTAKSSAPKPGVPRTTLSRRVWKRLPLVAGAGLVLGLSFVALKISRPIREPPLRRLSGDLGGKEAHAPVARGLPEVESRIFQVAESTGRVEAHRGGQWVPVGRGDVLTQDDVVRTLNGRAVLKFGTSTEVELRDRVEIRLDNISRAGASLDLRRGKVVARVGRSDSNIVITAAKTRTTNDQSAPARFVVLADERGQVTVAATEGAARFEAGGQAVVVPAGKVTHATAGQAPADPETIPEEIFLTVAWPTHEAHDETRVTIGGRVDPRSLVRVNGTPSEADRNGRFQAPVAIRDGTNPVEVEVEDISGRVRVEKKDLRKIPSQPPRLEPVKTELWNNK